LSLLLLQEESCSNMKKKASSNRRGLDPELIKQWHPTKNGHLSPSDVGPVSHKKVWWECDNGHEWEAVIGNRTRGNGCPFCAGKKSSNENNLAVRFPETAKEWHPTKNGDLSPSDVTPGSGKKVWWRCLYNADHEWQAYINNRTRFGNRCPFCSGLLATDSDNLAVKFPHIAKDWDYGKNGNQNPHLVKPFSHKKYHWKCENGHTWPAPVANRTIRGDGCPYCSGRLATPENNLATKFPELSEEWHPTKNKGLKPSDFTPGSAKQVYWKGKCGHDWKSAIHSRTRTRGSDCPYCSGNKVGADNNLAVLKPEVAKEWHPTKNGNLSPSDVTPGSGKKVWRLCDKGHEWPAHVDSRTLKGAGCPYCSGMLATPENNLAAKFPELIEEWHPTKNRRLNPSNITPYSHQIVWWKCKHHGHEWKASIANRSRGNGCPECRPNTSLAEIRLFCELKAIFHDAEPRFRVGGNECDIFLPQYRVAIEYDGVHWHSDKHTKDIDKKKRLRDHEITLFRVREYGLRKTSPRDVQLEAGEVGLSVVKKLAAALIQDVELSPNHRRHLEQYLSRNEFINNEDYLRRVANLPGPDFEESMSHLFPSIADEWDYKKNFPLRPEMFTPGTHIKVWWRCTENHEWEAAISGRTTSGSACPYCAGNLASPENNLLVKFPDIAKEWHPEKNGSLLPHQVSPNSNKKRWWMCTKKHEWDGIVSNRTRFLRGCPQCANTYHVNEKNNLKVKFPKIAAEWHPSKNADLTPHDVTPGSHRKVWWVCEKGHEWKAVISNRTGGRGCPHCWREK